MMDTDPTVPEEMKAAVRAAERARRADQVPAPAEAMLAMIREQAQDRPVTSPVLEPSPVAAWRATWQVGLAQLRVVHWAVLPTMLVALTTGSVLVGVAPIPLASVAGVHAMVVLLTVTMVAALCTPGDVRREFLAVTLIHPTSVLGARLAMFLGATFVSSAAASGLLSLLHLTDLTPIQAIGIWLGPATLLAAVVTWAGVWRGPMAAWSTAVCALIIGLPAMTGTHAVVPPAVAAGGGVLLILLALRRVRRPDLA